MKKLTQKAIIVPLALILMLSAVGCAGGIPNEVHSIEDVASRDIGALSGTPAIQLAADIGTAYAFDYAENMIAALLAGYIDCIIMESTTAQELIEGRSGVWILQDPILEYELRIAVPLENTRLLNAINAALEELDHSGVLRSIYNRHFTGTDFTYQPPATSGSREGTLIVALPPDSPPLSVMSADGRFNGMDVDVAIALADILGVYLQVLPYDAQGLVTSVWHGRADFAMGWHPDAATDVIHTSEPYAVVSLSVIVRR